LCRDPQTTCKDPIIPSVSKMVNYDGRNSDVKLAIIVTYYSVHDSGYLQATAITSKCTVSVFHLTDDVAYQETGVMPQHFKVM